MTKVKNRATDKKAPVEPTSSGNQQSSSANEPPFLKFFQFSGPDVAEEDIKKIIYEQVSFDLSASGIIDKYNFLFLHDTSVMVRQDTDRIYKGIASFKEKKPILLILNSNGGDISAGYLIAKLCREHSQLSFLVGVPRRAKSAATLICCGADEIHMGSLSELGPIDPQIDGIPALALKNAIEHVASLVKQYPAASDMFAAFLSKSLNLKDLGYYERVAVSAAHYATNLLKSREKKNTTNIDDIAHRLVYGYNDHGFVIDASEAMDIFGKNMIKVNTNEYIFSNRIYQSFNFIESICKDLFKRQFYFTGSATDGCVVVQRPNL